MTTTTLIQADARRIPLADRSVQCVVTSPPYYALRDYGTAKWEGGDAACDHRESREFVNPKNTLGPNGYLPETNAANQMHQRQFRDLCGKCGARRIDAQIGLEPSIEAYVATMVQVFREVRRVLRDDGTCWVNLGDSYSGGKTGRDDKRDGGGLYDGRQNGWTDEMVRNRPAEDGLPSKNLLGMPWRIAFALQADGWILRSDIIWSKPNPMPESVTDRPTKSHEYIFLLAKRPAYYYDAEAVREKLAPISESQIALSSRGVYDAGGDPKGTGRIQPGDRALTASGASSRGAAMNPAGRNARSVWSITPKPFSGWTRTSHQVRVASGVLSGDMTSKVSPDCPLHGCSDRLDSNGSSGAHEAHDSSGIGCIDSHRVRGQSADCEPILPTGAPLTLERSLDSQGRQYSQPAKPHSTRIRKMDHDLETNLPCTPFAQTNDHTGDTSGSLGLTEQGQSIDGCNTSAGSSSGTRSIQTSGDSAGTQISRELVGTSVELLREDGCTCLFYQEKTEETSHFATFPSELAARCIKAGTSERGQCPHCGTAWRRVVDVESWNERERKRGTARGWNGIPGRDTEGGQNGIYNMNGQSSGRNVTTLGWQPGCTCPPHEPVPQVVFDPFGGAGTVPLVASNLGRRGIMTELNPAYIRMARRRISRPHAKPERAEREEHHPLFAGLT